MKHYLHQRIFAQGIQTGKGKFLRKRIIFVDKTAIQATVLGVACGTARIPKKRDFPARTNTQDIFPFHKGIIFRIRSRRTAIDKAIGSKSEQSECQSKGHNPANPKN